MCPPTTKQKLNFHGKLWWTWCPSKCLIVILTKKFFFFPGGQVCVEREENFNRVEPILTEKFVTKRFLTRLWQYPSQSIKKIWFWWTIPSKYSNFWHDCGRTRHNPSKDMILMVDSVKILKCLTWMWQFPPPATICQKSCKMSLFFLSVAFFAI